MNIINLELLFYDSGVQYAYVHTAIDVRGKSWVTADEESWVAADGDSRYRNTAHTSLRCRSTALKPKNSISDQEIWRFVR